ncbi:MAG: hypothetical protein DSY58_02135 [Desulfobulbus sp.]|nr:MAG: hypothetical protein DSY58_02135 [Desulfobulbus sp.]
MFYSYSGLIFATMCKNTGLLCKCKAFPCLKFLPEKGKRALFARYTGDGYIYFSDTTRYAKVVV